MSSSAASASSAGVTSTTDNLYENLLTHRDVMDNVIFEWLSTKDLVQLDSAVVGNRRRKAFHQSLSNIRYGVPFEKNLEYWWRHHKSILKWFIDRRMYNSEGIWHVNQKLWEVMMQDKKYDPLIARMRGIRFENFNSETALVGLDKCTNLFRLEICNLLQPKPNGAPLNIPSLQELYVQNVAMNPDFLRLFSNVPSLKFIQFHHARYQAVPTDIANAFIGTVEKIKVIGDLDGFLTHIVQGVTRLQNVTIDKMHKAETTPQDLSIFLTRIPDVRILSVDRMRLHIPSFFKCLTVHNRHLRSLHLNHIRVMDLETPCPDVRVDLTCTRLQISTLLPSTNQQVMSIINLCKNIVSELAISFCSRLENDGYAEIARTCRLHSMEIDDRRELYEGTENAGRIDQIANIFGGVAKLRLTLWPEWKSEKEKTMVPHEKTIAYERGFDV